MNYYFESDFFANSQLTPQQQEKPTREEMLKMAISDVNKKNKKILENPLNQGSSNISDKQLQESKKERNQLNKEGEALSRKHRNDPAKQLVPIPKKDLEKIMKEGTDLAKQKRPELWDNKPKTNPVVGKLIREDIRRKALEKAKQSNPELWVNDSKQTITDKPNEFDKQATENNYNGVLILGLSLSLIVILILLIWKRDLWKRLTGLKNLIAQKIKIEDSNRARKAFNLFGIIWVLFHVFMLMTSREVLDYRISWNDLWLFDNFEDYYREPPGYKSHYDITEFSIYVIIPLVIVFGKKYLNGEQLSSFKVRASIIKSNTDVQINDIKKYKELFDLGVISEAEFIEQKRKILNK